MRQCIHSSLYDPAIHTIVGGPYSSPEGCSSCVNGNVYPPLLSLMNSKTLFNLNNFPVDIYLQWQPYNTDDVDIPIYDLGYISVGSNQQYDLTFLLNSIDSTNYVTIKARCTPLGLSSPTSSYSYNRFGTVYQEFAHLNTENIVAPTINQISTHEFTVSNPNQNNVGLFLEFNNLNYEYFKFDILQPTATKTYNTNFSITDFSFRGRLCKIGGAISVSTYGYVNLLS